MSSNGVGWILALVTLVVMAFWTSPDKPTQYVDAHGGFVVIVGTIVIAIISIPWADAKRLPKLVQSVAKREKDDAPAAVELLVQMADAARIDIASLRSFKEKTTDSFLQEAIDLLVDGYEAPTIKMVLKRRIEVEKEKETNQMKVFKNLGKYPPACGLMGTVMGMIALLATLGQEGAGEKIGPAMSVALAATLYGVIVANLVILPVADNLMFKTQRSVAKRQMIIEGILLIKQQTSAIIVRKMLSSHLTTPQPAQAAKGAA